MRDTYVFREVAVPGESGRLRQTIRYDAEVEKCRVYFAEGQASSLRIRVFVEDGRGRVEDLFFRVEDRYLTGDGSKIEAPVSLIVRSGDQIVVEFKNDSEEYDREVVVDVVVRANE